MRTFLLFFVYLLPLAAYSQVKLGGDKTVINPKAVLELSSSTQGFLMPRVSTTQMEAISMNSPRKGAIYGLAVFNTDSACIAQYLDTTRSDRSAWAYLCGSNNRQVVSGINNGLTLKDTVAVLGGQLNRKTIDTLNNFNSEWETNGNGNFMVRKRSGDTALLASNNSNTGIGTSTPLQKLHISGNTQLSQALMPGGVAGNSGQILTSRSSNIPPVWQDSVILTAGIVKLIKDSLATAIGKTPVRDSLRTLITRGDGLVFTSTVATNSVINDISTNFSSNQTLSNTFNNACNWGNNNPNIMFNSINATLDNTTGTITVGQGGLFNVYCFFALGISFNAFTGATQTGGVGVISVIIRCPAAADATQASSWSVVASNAYQYYLTNNNASGMANGISLNGVVRLNTGDRFRVVSYRTAVTSDNPAINRARTVVPAGLPFGFLFKLTRLVGS
ncbi:hypothetical protein [Chitinophaga vietnamensis]|uniref:hypothetical protein n=1 Tax=Chitinophaga vietnamensis TaxID=2593957 RepID=UPI001178242C|nr:hypothetical protein [Chitinophaga vietnamensis]